MKTKIYKVALLAIITSLYTSASMAIAVCNGEQTILSVQQAYPGMHDDHISIVTKATNGRIHRYTTSGVSNVTNSPKARALQRMALTGWAAGSIVWVFAKDDCTTRTYGGFQFVDKWVGLELIK